MISAKDSDNENSELTFTVRNVLYGHFEYTQFPGKEINTFTYEEILSEEVKFIQDGSDNKPSFEIKVSDGELSSEYEKIDISYESKEDSGSSPIIPLILSVGGTIISTVGGFGIKKSCDYKKAKNSRKDYPFAAGLRKSLEIEKVANFDKGDGKKFCFWATDRAGKNGEEPGLRYLLREEIGRKIENDEKEYKLAEEIGQILKSQFFSSSSRKKIILQDLENLDKNKIVDFYKNSKLESKTVSQIAIVSNNKNNIKNDSDNQNDASVETTDSSENNDQDVSNLEIGSSSETSTTNNP